MERSVAMVMVECAASLPSSSLALRAHVQTRIASVASTWAYFPVQETEGSRVRGLQCDDAMRGVGGWRRGGGRRREVVRMAVGGEPGAAAGGSGGSASWKERAVIFEESKKLLAMQKQLLDQIEERQKLYSSPTVDTDQPSPSIVTESSSEPQAGTPEPSVETSETFTSTPTIPSSSARPLTAAWPSPPPSKRSVGSGRAVAQANSPAPSDRVETSPKTSPPPSPLAQSKRDFHSDHSRESTGGNNSEVLQQTRTDAAAPSAAEKPPPLAGPNVMNVIVVAAECAPWSKTGGLGDVVGALPKALARRGHRVMVVAPRYSNYAEAWETGVRRIYNVGGQDVLTRMILLSKAAVETPWHVPCGGVCYGDGNLVFIANDWHTALVPVYLQAYYRDNGYMDFTRSVLVIHNMAHQGRGPLADYHRLGLPGHYIDKFRLFDPLGGEHNNIFMAGLITAHRIVTVSHGYAWEVQTPEGGWGLDGVLRDHNWKLRGVVNGIDDKEWNPELDVHLKSDGYTNYNLHSLDTGKAACKAALQRELGLPVRADVPLLGFIGRLDHQKGIDIIGQAMPWMMDQDIQLVMLGTGRKDYEDMLRHFEGSHRDKVRGWVGFSVTTSHRITAGVDILLMPSRFEPCGLNQLYAMRYGTVPVVHAVGGLKDTVQSFNPFNESGLGWTFETLHVDAFIHALGNAIWTYRDFKSSWKGIQQRGMSQDLSWDHAAQQYEEVLLAAKYTW
ncbi:granule-bound starch synthase 2, chloroplastic/amyloplastic isoform X2 [Physcomitrium patens]|uniref:Starch synthase catalytic domain-containing protein n=1 Tax=Physcomitrium patens TaxID=3218 RepID=A0A2K1IQY5_PHYPA|nr:hypothetical protein PHYPA_025813 [Physcomitrium patens]